MAYDFKKLKASIKEIEGWLQSELFGIRTGRATTALLDGVQVEAYGSKMPLTQLASLGIENARTIRVTPYDLSQIKDIERAINASNLGVTVGADDRGVRVSFPELTAERREQLMKLVGQKLEDARVSIRKSRDAIWDDIQEKTKSKEITEDEKFRAKDEMQKIVDEGNRAIETMAEKKRNELSQ